MRLSSICHPIRGLCSSSAGLICQSPIQSAHRRRVRWRATRLSLWICLFILLAGSLPEREDGCFKLCKQVGKVNGERTKQHKCGGCSPACKWCRTQDSSLSHLCSYKKAQRCGQKKLTPLFVHFSQLVAHKHIHKWIIIIFTVFNGIIFGTGDGLVWWSCSSSSRSLFTKCQSLIYKVVKWLHYPSQKCY